MADGASQSANWVNGLWSSFSEQRKPLTRKNRENRYFWSALADLGLRVNEGGTANKFVPFWGEFFIL